MARLPDGTEKWLIYIRDWDFRWQHVYRFVTPLALPRGTSVTMRYTYDNSAENPWNPQQPPERVSWGQRSSDEMGDLWLQMLTRNDDDLATLVRGSQPKMLDEDIIGYETMIRADPADIELHDDVALLYLQTGRPREAAAHFEASVRLKPQSAVTHYNLGTAQTRVGLFEEAIGEFRRALQIKPDYADAHNNLGSVLSSLGRLDEAIQQYREALRDDPRHAAAHNNLGNALVSQGNAEEALPHFLDALRINPEYADAHYNIGRAYALRGEWADAIEHYRTVVGLQPELGGWPERIGVAPRRPRRRNRLHDAKLAIRLAEHAADITDKRDAKVLDVLAAAYADAGSFDRARRHRGGRAATDAGRPSGRRHSPPARALPGAPGVSNTPRQLERFQVARRARGSGDPLLESLSPNPQSLSRLLDRARIFICTLRLRTRWATPTPSDGQNSTDESGWHVLRRLTTCADTTQIGGRIMRVLQHLGWVLVCALATPTAMAQQSASISGVVTDATGGVMPGVTVEASSPVLIEKVRTAISEGNGRYQFVDLQPGMYNVTFALQGFSTVRREGITLTAGFAASVNVELSAGAITETITVSGSSPMVDVRNVAQTQVMTRDMLDNTPTARVIGSLMTLVPGVTITTAGGPNVDAGGTAGYTYAAAQIHGSSQYDQTIGTYGIPMVLIDNIGKSRINLPDGTVEEYDMRYSSLPAELAYGGFTVNAIPKVGGNDFKGSIFITSTGSALHGSNLDDSLRAQGLTAEAKVKKMVDFNPVVGGPIIKDKIWFFGGLRYQYTDSYIGGIWYDKNPSDWIYEPDLDRPANADQLSYDYNVNTTVQASKKDRLNVLLMRNVTHWYHSSVTGTVAPEAGQQWYAPGHVELGKWTLRALQPAAVGRDRIALLPRFRPRSNRHVDPIAGRGPGFGHYVWRPGHILVHRAARLHRRAPPSPTPPPRTI